jgi:Outer membrane protein beta-barrel domain
MTNLNRLALLVAFLAGPGSLLPQTSSDSPPRHDPPQQEVSHWCTIGAGAGYSVVAGEDSSNLSGEWNFEAGAGFAVANRNATRNWSFFLDFDYLFDQTSVKSSALALAKNLNPTDIGLLNATGGKTRFNVVAFDPTFRWQISPHVVEAYVFGGFGWFQRRVGLTGVSDEGSLLQPGSPSVFLRNASSGSVDVGFGFNFRTIKSWAVPYVEVRVVHGLAVNSSTTLVPFAAGIRW